MSQNVPRFTRGVQIDMSTPKEQVRASIALTHSIPVAERLLQADKANPSFKLTDLRDDNERAIYIDAAASFLLDQVGRIERMHLLNSTRSHGHALADQVNEDVDRQARQDIVMFGDPILAKFMRTNPKRCPLCEEVLITNAVDVLLTPSGNITGRAHGLCCNKDERHFEYVSDFTYRLVHRG
jgi:hypothetical protein